MYMSPSKKKALKAYHRFLSEYEAKYPKTTACLHRDEDGLHLCSYTTFNKISPDAGENVFPESQKLQYMV
jgi:transposase-like protein